MTTAKPSDDLLAAIDAAYDRLFDTLDSLDDDGWRAPSVLPGWTRAHVVAHVNDNGTSFAEAAEAAARGTTRPVYASDEAREGAIEEGARRPGEELLAESSDAQRRWRSAMRGLSEKTLATEVERTPGSERRFRVADMPVMREREIEIHHVDLGAGYAPADWPDDFVGRLLDALLWDRGEGTPLTLVAVETGERVDVAGGGPEVRGTRADLAWWLAGRGTGEGLDADGGLPEIGPWVPRPRR